MQVSVILINRDGGQWLSRALASLRSDLDSVAARRSDFELLVVDNGSTDDSIPRIERTLAGASFAWRIVPEPVPGVNSSRNAGLAAARGDLLIFSDNDLTFQRGWLEAYLTAAEQHPDQEVFAGRVLVGPVEGDVPPWLDLTGRWARPSIVVQADYGDELRVCQFGSDRGPVGPNMAFRRSLLARMGPFDTRFGLRPGSYVPGAEAEYFQRLTEAGASFVYVPGAAVHHPLKKPQISKRYFLKRLHGIGRAHGRMQRLRGTRCTRILGVARYVMGDVLRSAVAWSRSWFGAGPKQRFFLRGNLAMHCGHLHEELVSAWRGDRPAAPGGAAPANTMVQAES
ncbi:MAG TPA: glycosyltransferase [Pirellulaceae bacterium]|nr:glycosyltransferase [Pirellulaceae bacterium]